MIFRQYDAGELREKVKDLKEREIHGMLDVNGRERMMSLASLIARRTDQKTEHVIGEIEQDIYDEAMEEETEQMYQATCQRPESFCPVCGNTGLVIVSPDMDGQSREYRCNACERGKEDF